MVEGADAKVESTKQTVDNEHLDDSNDKSNQKHHRKRKRYLFNAIRQQMEFYFSDANLAKDRYLKQLIEQDPCKCIHTHITYHS